MNKRTLIETISRSTGESRAAVKRVLDALRDEVATQVENGESIVIPGVCTIGSTFREARVIRQIHNGRKLQIGGRHVARIRPSARLKRAAASQTPQYWKQPEHQAAWKKAEVLVADVALYHQGEPPALTASTPDDETRAICAETFGDSWSRAEATYDAAVDPTVRDDHKQDYLAGSARERWSR